MAEKVSEAQRQCLEDHTKFPASVPTGSKWGSAEIVWAMKSGYLSGRLGGGHNITPAGRAALEDGKHG